MIMWDGNIPHGMSTPTSTDEVVHQPDPEFVASTNVAQFIGDYRIADYEELIERTCSDVEWFWDELVDYEELIAW